jgi:hypothetical protein
MALAATLWVNSEGTLTTARRGMSFRTLIPFFALAFGLTWGLAALMLLFPDQITSLFGEVSYTNPLFILAVYSPAFAGIFLVWRHYGVKGLGSYFRRLTLWRMPIAWWGFLAIGIPALFYLGAAIKGTIADPFPFSPLVWRVAGVGYRPVHRTHRGVRLARRGPAAAPAPVRPALGRLDLGCHLGTVACAGLPA